MRRAFFAAPLALLACSPQTTPVATTPPKVVASTAANAPKAHAPDDLACTSIAPIASIGDAYVPQPLDVATPANPKDACAMATSNVVAAADAILAEKPGPTVKSAAWDKKQKLVGLDAVTKRWALSKDELATLTSKGLVVPTRLGFTSFATAFHDVYQSELPLYVSVDAVFEAVFLSNDALMADLERARLQPTLVHLLDTMHCALAAEAARYPADVAHDLDVYLAVARSLLAGKNVGTALGTDDEVATLLTRANDAKELAVVPLFGRDRYVDFSVFTPRGHYTDDLAPYFRASMWLSRVEMNLSSRSCASSAPKLDPTETPREAVDAMALADLAERSGALADVEALNRAWSLFAGVREDVGFDDLLALMKKANVEKLAVPASADALRAAIGSDFKRTTRTQFMPEGSTVLPAIATMLGPRIVPDATMLMPLVDGQTPDKHSIAATEVAYALGSDRALAYLSTDLAQFSSLKAHLDDARALAKKPFASQDDLYSPWFSAIRAIAEKPSGVRPSFADGDAYADLAIDSIVSAYGQLRHNNVLVAGETYDEGGCEIPDAYLEPSLGVYDGLIEYAARGERVIAALDPDDRTGGKPYFARLGKLLKVFRTIAADELAGRALTSDEKRFLGFVVEMTKGSSGGPPTFTGWYFELFRDRMEALKSSAFAGSYFTSGDANKVYYAAAASPRLGVFVIDVGGPPRVAVGPVANAFGAVGPLEKRYDDTTILDADRIAPWRASYAVDAPSAPTFTVSAPDEDAITKGTVKVTSVAKATITLEALDHHWRVVKSITKAIPAGGSATFLFGRSLEKMHVHVGAYDDWFEAPWSGLDLSYGAPQATVTATADAPPAAP